MFTKDELIKIESMTGFIKVAWYLKEADEKWKKNLHWVSQCHEMLNKSGEKVGEEALEKSMDVALKTSRLNAIENYCFVADLINVIVCKLFDQDFGTIRGSFLYCLQEQKDAGEMGNIYREALRVLVTDKWGKQVWENITYF